MNITFENITLEEAQKIIGFASQPIKDVFEIRIPNLKPNEVQFVRDAVSGFTKELLNRLTAKRKTN